MKEEGLWCRLGIHLSARTTDRPTEKASAVVRTPISEQPQFLSLWALVIASKHQTGGCAQVMPKVISDLSKNVNIKH